MARPRLSGRPLLISCAVHGLALWLVVKERANPRMIPPTGWAQARHELPVEMAMVTATPVTRPSPRSEAATAGGGRPPGPRLRHAPPRLAGAVVAPSRAVTAAELPSDVTAAAEPAPEPVEILSPKDEPDPASAAGAEGEGRGQGEGAGDGDGSGSGDGLGDGRENLGKELHARILGDVAVDLPSDDGRTVLSHDQATALRLRDLFPRLPESLWPEWRPYVVVLRVCVDEQGRVTDTLLLSSAAPRLDRMVATAARSWQYRPLQRAGRATPFCHGVVIKYEHW